MIFGTNRSSRILTIVLISVATVMGFSQAAHPDGVMISEFMAVNGTGITDQDGDNSDWIEIFNSSDVAVDVTGWSLTDDAADLDKWVFPALTLASGESRLVFASGKDRTNPASELHTNFQLATEGEYLALVESDGVTIAQQFSPTYPPQKLDYSYGIPYEKTVLIEEGAEVHYKVPANGTLGTTWTGTGFVEDGSWVNGSTTIGYRVEPTGAVAGSLIVDLDAKNLALGPITSWSNAGTSGGAFTNSGTDPQVAMVGGIKAVSFDGTDYMASNFTTPSGMTGSSNWSVEVWVLDPLVEVLNAIVVTWSSGGGTGAGAELNYSFRTQSGAYWHSGFEYPWIQGTPLKGMWHHLVYTYAGGTNGLERTYQDGMPDSAEPASLNILAAQPIRLAQRLSGGGGFSGSIAVVRIHDGLLTPEQVASNYYINAPRFGRSIGPSIATNVQAAMQSVNPSIYLRIPFNVSNPGLLEALDLRMLYDDGFAAYLNGTEIALRNAPSPASWNSTASGAHFAGYEIPVESIPVGDHLSLLQAGSNVLAVQGLNLTAGDEDFAILPELAVGRVAGGASYLSAPSPGEINNGALDGYVSDTKFSVDRGFFDAPFQVSITTLTPDAEIRYTTDGSWPSETHGTVYAGPVSISTTTVLRALAYKANWISTDVDTQTYIFLNDVIHQPNDPAGYPALLTSENQKADYEMDPEVVDNPVYAATIINDLKSAPTLSIVVDKDAFFGAEGPYNYPYAKGSMDWERPASAELIYSDGTEGFAVNCGIRVQGAVSRSPSNFKHGMSLRFRNMYGSGKLRYPLYKNGPYGAGSVEEFDTVFLKSGFSYTWMDRNHESCERASLQRDQWVRDMHQEMGHLGGKGAYTHVYINGMYWGVYNMSERPDGNFMSTYYGGDHSDYDFISGAYGIYARSGDKVAWNAMQAMLNAGVAGDAQYAAVQEYLDIDNYIEYMMVNFYINMDDWDFKNYKAARKRNPASPFRFFVWDAEIIMGGQNGVFGITSAERINADRVNIAPKGILTGMLAQLKQNADFRRRFGDRVHRHFFHDGVFTPDHVTALWARRSAELYPLLVPESARWGDFRRDVVTGSSDLPADFALYTRDLFYPTEQNFLLNEYFPVRHSILINQFKTAGLYPNTEAPDYSVNGSPQHGGTVLPEDDVTLSAPAGSIYYTLDGSEFRGGGAGSGGSTVTFVTENASKRVLVPSSNIGTTWQSDLGFNDASWISGTGGVGYERTSGYGSYFSIDVASMYNTMGSCYIRVPFTVPESSTGYETLTLRMRYDDGFVAFLDGTRIASANPPGTLLWNSAASAGHADNLAVVLEDFNATAYANLLTTGNHVLAIQGLNDGTTSSDFLISFELVGTTGSTAPILPNAIEYTGPISLTSSTTIKAAAYSAGRWSALCEASFDVITASPGDIIITEVLPNANGEDDNKEWFEVYNTTDSAIDINGWILADNVLDSHTINNGGPLVVPSKGYLVLGQSTDPVLNGGAPVDYAYGVGTFTLGNGGDEIIIKQADQVVDAIGYEVFSNTPVAVFDVGLNADPGLAIGMAVDYCNGPTSFWQIQSSYYGTNGDTGTPGADNDGVSPCGPADTTPPILTDAKFARRDLIFLRFNEPLDPASAETTTNYLVDGTITPVTASLESQTTVLLEFSGKFTSGLLYGISVTDLEDVEGNPIVLEEGTLSYETPDVSITEVMYDNRGIDVEWIEILNTTEDPIDLSGWAVSDDNVHPASGEGQMTVQDGTEIQPGQYLVVNLWNDPGFANWHMPGDVIVANTVLGATGALNNAGDNVSLFDSPTAGTLIDGSLSADYPDLSADGESIEKIDELFPWGDDDVIIYNFRAATVPIGFETGVDDLGRPLSDYATPGRTNGKAVESPVNYWRLY